VLQQYALARPTVCGENCYFLQKKKKEKYRKREKKRGWLRRAAGACGVDVRGGEAGRLLVAGGEAGRLVVRPGDLHEVLMRPPGIEPWTALPAVGGLRGGGGGDRAGRGARGGLARRAGVGRRAICVARAARSMPLRVRRSGCARSTYSVHGQSVTRSSPQRPGCSGRGRDW
jgi:hypothetical protein